MSTDMSLLGTVDAALGTGPVCDWCLGRCVADRGAGLTVPERGWALRVVHLMETDEPYEPVEPADCWVCDGAAAVDFDAWTGRVADALADVTFETFQIGTRPPEEIIDNDHALREEAGLPAEAGVTFNAVVNAAVGDRLEDRTGTRQESDRPDVVVVLDIVGEGVEVQLNPVYLYGRYRKLESGLVQRVRQCPDCDGTGTVEADDGTVACERCDGRGRFLSVEELVAWPIRDAMDASEVVFQTAGREGVDALMLGSGRPFVLEVTEPRQRVVDPTDIVTEIREAASGRVEVVQLKFASPDIVGFVTQNPFQQRFELTVEFTDPIAEEAFDDAVDSLDGLTIRRHLRLEDLARGQRPHKVVRQLQDVVGKWRDERTATLAFEIDPGIDPTSIATGDGGETEPSLTELLETPVDVVEVAVIAVEGREEPFDDPTSLRGSSPTGRG